MDGFGLQKRILLIVALGLAAVLLLFGYLAESAVQQSKDLVFQERLALAKTVSGYIDSVLSRTLNQIEVIVSRNPVDLGNGSLNDEKLLLSGIYQDLGSFSSVELVGADGRTILREPASSDVSGRGMSDLPFVQRVFRSGIPSIDLLDSPDASSAHIVFLSVPLWDRGEVIGAVVSNLSLARGGLDTLPAPYLGRTGYSELIDGTGLVIASSGNIPAGSYVDHTVVLKPLLVEHQAGVVLHRMPQGAVRPDHIVAYAPLSTVPWGVVVEQDQDVALVLPQELQNKMLLIGLLIVLVAGAVAWIAVRRLVIPLKILSVASERMAGGDLESAVAIKRGDEIGTLARSFEAMRAKLNLSLTEIRRWNEELEDRVAKRTAEVERRNRELMMLNSLAETVNGSLDLEEVLTAALDRVLNIMEAEAGSITLRD
ncbi:MAG: cache domain-containing protein, partial [Dehalococcoidia bacterium]|nr:cache domain-containing protein [Dehalococcoidia bacterium]